MSHISVAGLEYAHPGGATLFSDVSFGVSPGTHAALVGNNGVGKTTLMRVLAGELAAMDGDAVVGGEVRYMPQDVGVGPAGLAPTVRDLLVECSPARLRSVGRRLMAAERAAVSGSAEAALALAQAIADWSDVDGYLAEAGWDASIGRIVRSDLDEIGSRPASFLSGGERKRLVLDVLFASDADVLLLDEPDNYLDVPAKRWLEDLIGTTRKTVLFISHDRELLATCSNRVLTLEASGAWVHGESYRTYPEAREARQRQLGDAVARWNQEERRLFRFYKLMKQRAAISPDMAARANAAETRWKRFAEPGPPPAPAVDQRLAMRLRGGDSGRRVLALESLELTDLTFPFSDEVYLGERIGVVGPNGSGKTHLVRLVAGEPVDHGGSVKLGARVLPGMFSQVNDNPEFRGRGVLALVVDRTGNEEAAMKALARYGLAGCARQVYDTLSGGQKARLEILGLELDGHNLLLLDEPTDNLDIDSAEALERALDGFEGTVIAVSHDRAFLATFDRFWMMGHDGLVHGLPDYGSALAAVLDPDGVDRVPLAKLLTTLDA